MELVTVWIDYMIAINWMYKNSNNSSKNEEPQLMARNG
jgi:hypothetical protein